jgi:4-amino-4-deoxy-L-arabinose transferase-like glycosyltransferase
VTGEWSRDLAVLLAFSGLLLFSFLGHAPLANPDEGRYVEIAREMVVSGDWVTPRLNNVVYFEKPPLVYWMLGFVQKYVSSSEWALRTVPVLFGLIGVGLTYVAGRKLYDRCTGLIAALVLATSVLYFGLCRIIILDIAVSVLISATLFCFMIGIQEPAGKSRRLWFYGLYLSAALATLAKGLIGFLVPGAAMFLWLLVFNQWKRLRPLYLPTGLLLFIVVALPWHVLVALRNDNWFDRYIVYEHWLRFFTPAADRPGPWWYFVPAVIGGIFPWVGFLWSALRNGLGRWSERNNHLTAWFLFVWAAFIFLFFSKSQSKLIPYILPVFPPLAVLIGRDLARRLVENSKSFVRGVRIFSVAGFVIGAAVLIVVFNWTPQPVIKDVDQAAALRPYASLVAAILFSGGALCWWVSGHKKPALALVSIAGTIAAFYLTLAAATQYIQKPGTRELAFYIKTHAQPGDRVMHYHEFFHDFLFYAESPVDVINYKGELELEEDAAARASDRFPDDATFRQWWEKPQRIYVVARKKDVVAVRNGQPTNNLFTDPTFRYHLIAESPDHYLFSNLP